MELAQINSLYDIDMNIAPYRTKLPEPLPPEKGHGGATGQVRGKRGPHVQAKKSLRNFFKSGGFNQDGGYLLSHCDAVPSA